MHEAAHLPFLAASRIGIDVVSSNSKRNVANFDRTRGLPYLHFSASVDTPFGNTSNTRLSPSDNRRWTS
jgi:hypothetical protein